MSYASDSYSNAGSGDANLHSLSTITGGASNGLTGHMVVVTGFSGIDVGGFDTSQFNGTWYCVSSGTNQVTLRMFLPSPPGSHTTTGSPVFTVGSFATIEGFFVDGWVVPPPSAFGGVAGFFVDGWQIPDFFAMGSKFSHVQPEVPHATDGQIFPTGQANDDDYIAVAVQN